jgi:hypothetical protein
MWCGWARSVSARISASRLSGRTTSHLNERFPGIHLGFGAPNQPEHLVPYDADIHLDVITRGAVVECASSGRRISLQDFVPEERVLHPALIRDMDVAEDCCARGCRPDMPGIRLV